VSIPDVCQCPEAILLQFEKEIRIIETADGEGLVERYPFAAGEYK
jgi:hypothetical protein